MPAIRQSSLDLDYRPGVRVGPSLTFSPFRRGALITPVLTRRELDSAARKRPTSASYRVASEAILLQRIFAHAFSQSTSPTSILRVSKNFNSLARPIFLRNITIHTEAALTRIIQGTFLPLKDRRHVVCIQFNSFPVKSSFESLGANPTPRPFAFPNIRTVRFAFSMGIPLPPDRRDVDQMVIIDALVNGYLQARLFESICAGRLNPTRFEWVPRRKPQCSGLRTAAGSDVSGASIDSKLDESFRILGMTWGLWSLLQSWTRLETIELVGLCLLEMETFDHCTISLPCHKVIISSCALGTGGLNDPWHFLAGPGRMVGSLQCGDLVLRNYSYPTCSVQDSSTSLNCFLGLLYPSSVFNTRPILRRLPHLSNGCETSVRHPCEAVLRSPPSSSVFSQLLPQWHLYHVYGLGLPITRTVALLTSRHRLSPSTAPFKRPT